MDINNDSGNQSNNRDFDDYIADEIIDYYGQDLIDSAKALSNPPALPKRKARMKKLLSVLSIVCAVIFLTGTLILTGIFMNSKPRQPSSENNSESFSAVTSSDFEGTASRESSDTSEKINTESSSDTNSQISSSSASSDSNVNASSNVSSEDSFSRDREYSLPEIPDEGTVTSVHTDVDNNSTTNPNDNVTTGKRVFIWVGIFSMIFSLAVSLVLNKLRAEYE